MSWAAVMTSLVLAGCAAVSPSPVLSLAAPSGEPVFYRRVVKPGDTITYRFVHAVSGTPVEEEWEVVRGADGPGLRLRTISYHATGAGLPAGDEVPPGTVESTPKGLAMRNLDRPVGLPLDLRVTPTAKNALVIGGEVIDLTRFPSPTGDGFASVVRLALR